MAPMETRLNGADPEVKTNLGNLEFADFQHF
jgi:hypothetical protein